MIASTKVANTLALGGGIFIFFVVAAITVYMTHEYNKAKDFEELEEKYNETLLRLNETLGDGNLGHQYWIKNWGQAYQNHL